jgi:hypothetical protein
MQLGSVDLMGALSPLASCQYDSSSGLPIKQSGLNFEDTKGFVERKYSQGCCCSKGEAWEAVAAQSAQLCWTF